MIELHDIPVFSALDETYLKELKNVVHVKNYTKDSIVFYEYEKG